MTFETSFIANREVRFIPAGWLHPKDERGRFIPHYSRHHYEDLMQTLEPDERRPTLPPMPEVDGLRPERLEIAAYETTTEGTPISPAYPNTPEGRLAVAKWCAEHETTYGDFKADAEAWAAMLFTDHVVLVDGSDGSIRIP